MKITYRIEIVGSNSCGSKIDIHCSGHGNAIDYTLAHLKASNELHNLLNEEFSASMASLETFNKSKK